MASLWKHPKSKYWFACIRLPDGKRTKRSTKETDRKKAQAIADKWESMARAQLTAIQSRKLIAECFKISTGDELSQFTIRAYLEKWAKAKKPEIDPVTAQKYEAAVAEFLTHIGDKADKDLLRLTLEDLHSFRDAVAGKSSAKTANNKLVIISQAVRTAYRDGHIPDDVAGRVRRLKLQGKQQKRLPFTADQMKEIFRRAEGEWKGIVLFGYYTGQRLGDIATLRWRDIDQVNGVLSIVSEKQARHTRVPLVPVILKWLDNLHSKRRPDSPVFPEANASTEKNGGKVSALSKQFQALLAEAGYAEKREWKSQGKGRDARRKISPLSFHSFRHSLTSDLKIRGRTDADDVGFAVRCSRVVPLYASQTSRSLAKRGARPSGRSCKKTGIGPRGGRSVAAGLREHEAQPQRTNPA